MEKNPKRVAKRAAALSDENSRFRSYVRLQSRRSPARVDGLAARLGMAAEAEMDCTQCAACCRENWIVVSDEEIERLARRLEEPVVAFRERYISENEYGEQAIDAEPCPFLTNKHCGVYNERPAACRDYPYIGGHVSTAMDGALERASTCPIVFETIERLKDALHFPR